MLIKHVGREIFYEGKIICRLKLLFMWALEQGLIGAHMGNDMRKASNTLVINMARQTFQSLVQLVNYKKND